MQLTKNILHCYIRIFLYSCVLELKNPYKNTLENDSFLINTNIS